MTPLQLNKVSRHVNRWGAEIAEAAKGNQTARPVKLDRAVRLYTGTVRTAAAQQTKRKSTTPGVGN